MKKKILIVDDESDIRETFASFLERRGVETALTGNGDEALELVNRFKPDAIILDLTIHGKNGMEVLGVLSKEHSEIPVVVVSGAFPSEEGSDKVLQENVNRLGAKAFMRKPLVIEELGRVVCNLAGANFSYSPPVSNIEEETKEEEVSEINISEEASHTMANLVGIIKNKSEDFTMSIDENLFRTETNKEIVDIAYETMKKILSVADRMKDELDNLNKPENTKIKE